MATYNLGRFIPIFRGNYSPTYTYQYLDLIYYNGSTYVAKRTVRNITPVEIGRVDNNWQIVALKGELSPTLSPTQIESIIEQISAQSGWVSDSQYNHTDNNFTNAYRDTLDNIGNAQITIQRNGINVGAFNTNQQNNQTINITVPTNVGELQGAGEFLLRPKIVEIEITDVVIDMLEDNTIYYCKNPIVALNIDNMPYNDILESCKYLESTIIFTTDSGFNFNYNATYPLKWSDNQPQFADNKSYRLSFKHGVGKLEEII